MNEEAGFQAALDANPDDFQTRLAFADWLRERDDPRADGYQVMGELRMRPASDTDGEVWTFGSQSHTYETTVGWAILNKKWLLPGSWLVHMKKYHQLDWDYDVRPWWRREDSREKMENRAAIAFQLMPADERTAILARRYEG